MKIPRRLTATIPLASTSDIAFLLLIFFLTISTIGSDKGLGITLSSAEKQLHGSPPVEILIRDDGKILVEEHAVELRELKSVLRLYDADGTFAVRTTPGVRYSLYIAVLDLLRISNIRRIAAM